MKDGDKKCCGNCGWLKYECFQGEGWCMFEEFTTDCSFLCDAWKRKEDSDEQPEDLAEQ